MSLGNRCRFDGLIKTLVFFSQIVTFRNNLTPILLSVFLLLMDILRKSASEKEDLGLLAIMDVLDQRARITQRELAKATGLNLKKVNYCLKKLLEKGYIKFQRARYNPDKRVYLYILTPAGIHAKSVLTYNFLKFTLDFYGQMEVKLWQCLQKMAKAGQQRVLLFGVSDVVRILLDIANEIPVEIIGVLDDNYEEDECYGLPVVRSKQLKSIELDIVLVSVLEGIDDADAQLLSFGIHSNAIWHLS